MAEENLTTTNTTSFSTIHPLSNTDSWVQVSESHNNSETRADPGETNSDPAETHFDPADLADEIPQQYNVVQPSIILKPKLKPVVRPKGQKKLPTKGPLKADTVLIKAVLRKCGFHQNTLMEQLQKSRQKDSGVVYSDYFFNGTQWNNPSVKNLISKFQVPQDDDLHRCKVCGMQLTNTLEVMNLMKFPHLWCCWKLSSLPPLSRKKQSK